MVAIRKQCLSAPRVSELKGYSLRNRQAGADMDIYNLFLILHLSPDQASARDKIPDFLACAMSYRFRYSSFVVSKLSPPFPFERCALAQELQLEVCKEWDSPYIDQVAKRRSTW